MNGIYDHHHLQYSFPFEHKGNSKLGLPTQDCHRNWSYNTKDKMNSSNILSVIVWLWAYLWNWITQLYKNKHIFWK